MRKKCVVLAMVFGIVIWAAGACADVQLLLIRHADTTEKKVGDIIGVFEGSHEFSADERAYFYIARIAGFETALELKKVLRETRYEIKTAYRVPYANTWVFDQPEEKEFWRDLPDGKWCEYNHSTKYKLNYYALTEQDRKALSEPRLSLSERIDLLKKCENRIKSYPENLIENENIN